MVASKYIFFSQKWLILVFSVLVLFTVWRQETFRNYRPDRCRQMHSAWQIEKGKGYVTCHTDTISLNKENCWTEFGWPMGYSAVLRVLNEPFGDLYLTAVVFDYVVLTFFWGSLIWLIFLTIPKTKERFLLLAILAISFAPIHYLSTTCQFSLSCLMSAIGVFVCVEGEKLKRGAGGIIMGLLIGLASFFRYAYYPIAAGIVFFLLWSAVESKEWKKYISLAVGFSVTYVCLYFFFQSLYSYTPVEGALQIASLGKGFYPKNLLKTDEFVLKFLFFLNPLYTIVEGDSSGDFTQSLSIIVRVITMGASLFVMGVFVLGVYSGLFKDKSLHHRVDTLGVIIVGATVLPYIYISLTTPAQQVGTLSNYSFVQETRYYAPIIPFILIFWTRYASEKGRFSQWFRYGLYAALFFGGILTTGIFFKTVTSETPLQGTYKFYYEDAIREYRQLGVLKKQYPNERWIYADSTHEPNPLIAISGCELFYGDILPLLQKDTLSSNTIIISPESYFRSLNQQCESSLEGSPIPIANLWRYRPR